MRTVVTGVAGFIGSRLAGRLLDRGDEVVGVDMFTPYYDLDVKKRNLAPLQDREGFTFHELDLRKAPLEPITGGAEVVFHLAAQPGVRMSWGEGFHDYAGHNVIATQRLLEAVAITGARRVVFASSSSVYGDAEQHPTPEDVRPAPISPYGVTKLTCEHLLQAYRRNLDLNYVALRYFTVYGPGQRPDMAFHRFCKAAITGQPITVYGDGEQTRDVTYVDDAVDATLAASTADGVDGRAINVGGGSQVSMLEALRIVEELAGAPLQLNHEAAAKGDPRRTSADLTVARELLGFEPKTPVADGLPAEYRWLGEREGHA